MRLINRVHKEPNLGIHGVVPPLPNVSLWLGASLLPFLPLHLDMNYELTEIGNKTLTIYLIVGFELLTAVVMKRCIFQDIRPRSPLKVNRRFGRTCEIHIQGRTISQTRNEQEA
jgi:hypothetical protein